MALTVSYGSNTAVTGWSTALADVTASGTSTSGAITDNTYPALKLECEFNSDNVSGTNTVDIYLLSSTDGGTGYATTETANMRYVGSVLLNGTNLIRKVITVGNLPNDFKFYIKNNDASYGLGANSVISYQTVTYVDA